MGSLKISCVLTEGPLGYSREYTFIFPKVPGRTFFPNLSKSITFAAAPLVLTPFVRNQAEAALVSGCIMYGCRYCGIRVCFLSVVLSCSCDMVAAQESIFCLFEAAKQNNFRFRYRQTVATSVTVQELRGVPEYLRVVSFQHTIWENGPSPSGH